jgi:hypothetical protein
VTFVLWGHLDHHSVQELDAIILVEHSARDHQVVLLQSNPPERCGPEELFDVGIEDAAHESDYVPAQAHAANESRESVRDDLGGDEREEVR